MDAPKKKRLWTCWNVPSSTMAKNCSNPIRKLVDSMKITPNPDKEMIALSIGDPTIFGNLPPAKEAEEAVIETIKSGKCNGYVKSFGSDEARIAVAKYESCGGAPITADDILLCSGCSSAIEIAILALADPGQNILVPRPGFSLYRTLADASGIVVKYYDLLPDKSWEVDLKNLESQIDNNTVAIITNNPSNPCGSVYTQRHIREICAVAEKYKLPIIADEIYAHVVFPGHKFHPFASQTKEVPILSCGGLTKRFIVPGWRMGWLVIHDRNGVFDKEVRAGLLALTTRTLGPNSLIQGALPAILEKTPQSLYDDCIDVYKTNAEICYQELSKIPGLRPVMPCGAMYMMVGIDIEKFPALKNDVAFTESLVIEQSVFCLPAECFQYPNFFRIVLTMPPEKVAEAMERIKEFCERHHQVEITNGQHA